MCTKKDNSHLITRESHVPFYYITRNAFKYNKKTKKNQDNKHNVYSTKTICTSLNNKKTMCVV